MPCDTFIALYPCTPCDLFLERCGLNVFCEIKNTYRLLDHVQRVRGGFTVRSHDQVHHALPDGRHDVGSGSGVFEQHPGAQQQDEKRKQVYASILKRLYTWNKRYNLQ